MVLTSVSLLESNKPNAGQTLDVQCLVSDLALYPLPANIRIESIDFENLILQHVKSNLSDRSIDATDFDLTRDMINDTVDSESTQKYTNEIIVKREQKTDCQFIVSLEANRGLVWAALKSPEDLNGKFDFSRHCCHMQTCFSEIKLCYVNIQLPNIIIWLLSSIPRKIVKKEVLTARCDSQLASPSKQKLLFALVWQCFREIDVVNLRQAYKHLRITKKTRIDSTLTGKLIKDNESDMMSNKKLPYDVDMHSTQNQAVSVGKSTSHHILSRQRQPAKLIHENTPFPPSAHHATLERKPVILSQKKSFPSQIRSFLNASESEFDTTQISNYLSHNCKSPKNSCSTKTRTRSRSVESPRHRFRLMYKPICDDIEILTQTSHTINKQEPRRKNRTLNGSDKNKKSKDFFDSLNSEGSSLSDESTSGEFVPSSLEFEYFNLAKLNSEPKSCTPIVIKSVLKKSSSYFEGQSGARVTRSGFFSSSTASSSERTKLSPESRKLDRNSRQCASNCNKKNVTFSAYATIQVVDN